MKTLLETNFKCPLCSGKLLQEEELLPQISDNDFIFVCNQNNNHRFVNKFHEFNNKLYHIL